MRGIIFLITVIVFTVSCYSQGMNIMANDGIIQYIHVGSLMKDKNSGSNREKIKVEIFGGDYGSHHLGSTIYRIGTRFNYVINKETYGGQNAENIRYKLKVFDNGNKFDIVIETVSWAALVIRSWILDSTPIAHEVQCAKYDISGKIDVTNQFKTTIFLCSNSNGNIGIGTDNPQYKLDVNGTSHSNNIVVGNQGTPNSAGSIERLSIAPYGHTGRWTLSARDIPGIAFLDLNYGSNKLLTFNHSKKIGILTDNPQSELDVAGTIRAKEVKIEATGWSDFVFDNNYDLLKLSDVEKHISDNRHLLGIPSEKEVLENGVNVVDMQAKLLQKIEELTLYVIGQDKRIEVLEEENKEIKSQLNDK